MLVKELIKELEQQDPDSEVWLYNEHGDLDTDVEIIDMED